MRAKTVILTVMICGAAAAAAQQHQKPQGHMDHKFDDPAHYAKSFDDPARDAWQMPARVIEALKLAPGATIADIGAGTGYFTVRLARALPQGTVYAVDVEPKMLEHLRARAKAEHLPNVVAVQAAAASANIPKPVDAILIVNTYHHLPDRAAYFRALRQSLTTAGRVAIVDYRKDSSGEGPPPEFRFTPEQIVTEMAEAGYALEARHDFLPRQNFLIFTPSR